MQKRRLGRIGPLEVSAIGQSDIEAGSPALAGCSRRQVLTAVAAIAAAPLVAPLAGCAGAHHRAQSEGDAATRPSAFPRRRLGTLEVSALGLGCMNFAWAYGPPTDRQHAIRVIRAAHERGVTFFDTAEVYCPFTSEEMVGEAVAPFRDQVVIASKFGFAERSERGRTLTGKSRLASRMVHVADVFEALAAPARRAILDELQDRDGQTLFELCTRLAMKHGQAMSRQAISQHFEVLEAAGLVTTRREGRYKFHHIDPAPLRAIVERWPARQAKGPGR